MKVLVADPAGACYGVERALKMAYEAAEGAGGRRVCTLGPLIHNPVVLGQLAENGVNVIETLDCESPARVVIRSHGVTKELMEAALDDPLIEVIDATCPHVARVQREAKRLADDGRFVIVVGEHGHPEVEGIASYAGERHAVVADVSEIPDLPCEERVGIVVQTTQSRARLDAVEGAVRARHADVEAVNTICAATARRQEAAADLARRCDAMVVLGGKNSGNTRRLAELCTQICGNTHHIEHIEELDPAWFAECATTGVTAGASTPNDQIATLIAALEELR